MLCAYYGHHKSATKWVLNIIDDAYRKTGLRHQQFHSPKLFQYDAKKYIEKNNINVFSYTNADWQYVKNLRCKGFHVIRDPRDIMVSAYYSHLNSHETKGWPELAEHRKTLVDLPKDEGLLADMDFTANLPTDGVRLGLIDCMYNWNYQSENVLEVKYEDLVKEPYEEFKRIFNFMGLMKETSFIRYLMPTVKYKISEIELNEAIDNNNYKKLSGGRNRGEENTESHYRRELPGDGVNHFNEVHKVYCKREYGDILVKLGYEENNNW